MILAGDPESFAHQGIEGITVRLKQTRLAATLSQLDDDASCQHFAVQPRHPFSYQRRGELIPLEHLPEGLVRDHRHEVGPFGQTKDVPQVVVKSGAVDSVALAASR